MITNKKSEVENMVVSKIRETIGESVDQFLSKVEKRNANTLSAYKGDIEQFFSLIFNKEYKYVTVEELNEMLDINGLMSAFEKIYNLTKPDGSKLYKNNTINRKQSCIKEVLDFLRFKKQYEHNAMDVSKAVESLPKDTDSIEYISFHRALEYAQCLLEEEKYKADEKYYAALLAIDTGKRATEIVSMKWSDFTVDEGFVVIRGVGKGNKKWNEKISIEFYNNIREKLFKDGVNELFTVKYIDLARAMSRVKVKLGDSERNISFHSFRKCAITAAFRVTGDVLEAQRKGNHSDINTTVGTYLESENYGITGMISLAGGIDEDLYKNASKEDLIKAIEEMNKDFKFLLNHKINELNKNK